MKHRKKNILPFAALVLSLLLSVPAAGFDWVDLEDSGKATILNFPAKTPRSTSKYSFIITDSQFQIYKSGRGAFYQFDLVDWSIQANGTIKDSSFIQHSSLCIVKDLQGRLLYEAQKTFDYENKNITIRLDDYTNPRRPRKRNFTYPIKGLTVDEASLTDFVRSFAPSFDEKGVESFYLVTFEPALYRVLVKPQGQETLTLPGGEYDCHKVRLIADMGILDHILDRYVPPTFVWYEKSYPFRWVQYQGLEAGRFSTSILSHTEE